MAKPRDIVNRIDSSALSDDKYDDLTEENVLVKRQFNQFIERGVESLGGPKTTNHSRTPQASKNIYEVFDLIEWSIAKQEAEENKPQLHRVKFIHGSPDSSAVFPAISASITRREPGAYSEGAPFEGKVKARKPMLREIVADEDDSRYRKLILGIWYDNLITLTCWAKTNKEANNLSLWLEKHMVNYTWLFRSCGVNKILYDGRDREISLDIDKNMIYGRPIKYFVRTELISTMNEKKLSKILILAIKNLFE